MIMHKFGFTEEFLSTKLLEGIKEKQKSHETLALTKMKKKW